jgi:hypothetical protein
VRAFAVGDALGLCYVFRRLLDEVFFRGVLGPFVVFLFFLDLLPDCLWEQLDGVFLEYHLWEQLDGVFLEYCLWGWLDGVFLEYCCWELLGEGLLVTGPIFDAGFVVQRVVKVFILGFSFLDDRVAVVEHPFEDELAVVIEELPFPVSSVKHPRSRARIPDRLQNFNWLPVAYVTVTEIKQALVHKLAVVVEHLSVTMAVTEIPVTGEKNPVIGCYYASSSMWDAVLGFLAFVHFRLSAVSCIK